jgi:hypothetical protein
MGLLAHPLAAFAVLPLLGTLIAKVVIAVPMRKLQVRVSINGGYPNSWMVLQWKIRLRWMSWGYHPFQETSIYL